MDLESAIAQQVGDKDPEEVLELVLDACKATKVSGLDKFVNLQMLTLNGCGLTSLEGFPTLDNLKSLELSDNALADGCLDALQDAGLPFLNRLSLAGNRFSTLAALEPLACLPSLRDVDLFNCPVTEVDNYRDGVFDLLQGLKYLDGFDQEDNEKEEDEDEDDGEEGDDDLLSSEVGEEEDDELGEDDDDDELGPSEDDDLGEDDGELGEEDDEGEEGEEGEEGDEEDEDEEEDDDESEEAAQGAAKRQRR